MSTPDLMLISDFARAWGKRESQRARAVVEHDELTQGLDRIEAALCGSPPRSSLLVGPPGVGKTAWALALGRRLRKQGWIVFETSSSDIMSGRSYIGQVEERVQQLLASMRASPRLLWICPAFHELTWAGRHNQSPVGLLELLVPHLETGAIRMVGETSPAAWELMVQLVPKVRSVLETVRIKPLEPERVRALAETRFGGKRRGNLRPEVIAEAARLADQFLIARENPGRLLELLDSTKQRVLTARPHAAEVALDDVLVTLSTHTGMPIELLDDRRQMSLAEVRGWFDERILGQSEAVQAVVERIALVKAGLTDPTRPLAVFLFVGPTGTGKTEIAKALATYLFRSSSRLLRLDMSEFQDPASLDRILGERGSVADPGALVTRIREHPFSIVLLDEFEKAHPSVWDLFLQVFDDGRLTARDGTTADFRNAIVIMTSNLGAADAHGAGLGFGTASHVRFEPSTIRRTLEGTFRPEFLNRIDRVVLFRPLSRLVMRTLLDLELRAVYERRGLRRRGWAIEWDEAALEHLIDHGFSPTLGARPLKRAVEQRFLAPLAEVIVEHRAPEGEQFLFVRLEDGRLAVQFVDPDAPEDASRVGGTPTASDGALSLERVALDGEGTAAELRLLTERTEALREQVRAPVWASAKEAHLARMAEAGFWQREDRFHTLGLVEYMDRVERALGTAGSLLSRLETMSTAPRALVRRLAELLYLIREAVAELADERLGDAYLHVRAAPDPQRGPDCERVARRLAAMYRGWGERRRMKVQTLAEGNDGGGRWECLLAVSGFGAHRILQAETGQHVFELEGARDGSPKVRVAVRVVPQPLRPVDVPRDAERIARTLLDQRHPNQSTTIVRRYREAPDPLVRDAVRGWRTGRFQAVLDGDFDLMA